MKQFYYKNNRLQQLRGFYHAVQTGSISSCAKRLGLTQAAISMQIQSLERDLDLKLISREKKQIKLTKDGKLFYSHSLQYVQGLEDLFESSSNFIKNQKKNLIRIGANHATICYILPKYIKKFKELNPSVKINICNIAKKEGIKRLIENEIDFLLYPIDQFETPEELEFINIKNYNPIALVNKNNPLAKKKMVTFKEIRDHEIIRIDPKLITLPYFEEVIKTNKLQSSISFEMADWEILKKFVQENIGISIISNIVLEGENKESGLIGLDIENYSSLTMPYGMLTKKGRIFNEKQKSFFELIKEGIN